MDDGYVVTADHVARADRVQAGFAALSCVARVMCLHPSSSKYRAHCLLLNEQGSKAAASHPLGGGGVVFRSNQPNN